MPGINEITEKQYCYRQDIGFVSCLPAKVGSQRHSKGDGVDWGYTSHTLADLGELDKPIVLSAYWARRFRADCARVGKVARFYPVA